MAAVRFSTRHSHSHCNWHVIALRQESDKFPRTVRTGTFGRLCRTETGILEVFYHRITSAESLKGDRERPEGSGSRVLIAAHLTFSSVGPYSVIPESVHGANI